MTGRPWALRDLALASTARVADSAMPPMRAETRARVAEADADGVLVCALTRPSSHGACRRRPAWIGEKVFFVRSAPLHSWAPGDRGEVPAVSELRRFLWAVAQQESGGRYHIRNGIGALGKYQVMPGNVGPWTQRALGRRLTPEEFLADPAAQDKVAEVILGGYYHKYGVRGAAAAWYSGNPALSESTRPQRGGPSIAQYADEVQARMGRAPAAA